MGEVIVSEMANRKPETILRALRLDGIADSSFVSKLEKFAFCESKLCPLEGYSFDGMSRVDVTLWIRHDLAVACELKLGLAGLNKAQIDKKLAPCRPAHENTRLAGSMMAILDRRFGSVELPKSLSVQLEGEAVPLCRDWLLIAQRKVLDRWKGYARPAFSDYTKCISINTIVESFGERKEFNALVSDLLAFDYFDKWLAE